MTTPLFAYQEEGVAWAMGRQYGLLAFDPGLGKSRTILETAKRLGLKRILVICPKSVLPVWLHEARRWWPDGPRPLILTKIEAAENEPTMRRSIAIMNWDRLSRDDSWSQALTAGARWDLVICDEAHAIKDPNSLRTRRFYTQLFPHADRVFLLTATPAPNHYGEFYPALRNCHPQAVTVNGRVLTKFLFEDRYCVVEHRHVGRGQPVRVISGSKNGADLKERIGEFMLRRRKEEVLKDLPPKQIELLPLHPTRDGFSAIAAAHPTVPDELSDDELLSLVENDASFAELRRALGMAKAGAVVPWVEDFLNDNKLKLILWAVHHSVIDHLTSQLADYNAVKLDGRDALTIRERAIDRFLNDDACRIFIGQIKACGTGLTLLNERTQPHDCLFVETTFSPADQVQAMDRIHRIGQPNQVLARVAVADQVWIDERVQNILIRKAKALAEVM